MIQRALVDAPEVKVGGTDGDRAGNGVGGTPVKLGEEEVEVRGDEVDDVVLDGLGSGEGSGLNDGLLQLIGIAAAFFGNAADKGGSVIGDLVRQGFGQFLPGPGDGVAAPMLVPGAMAAKLAAAAMNVPAEPA